MLSSVVEKEQSGVSAARAHGCGKSDMFARSKSMVLLNVSKPQQWKMRSCANSRAVIEDFMNELYSKEYY
jgi:hypothetical protein